MTISHVEAKRMVTRKREIIKRNNLEKKKRDQKQRNDQVWKVWLFMLLDSLLNRVYIGEKADQKHAKLKFMFTFDSHFNSSGQ